MSNSDRICKTLRTISAERLEWFWQ